MSAGECDEKNHAQWVGGGVNPKCQQKKILKVEIFVIQITVFVFLGLVPFFLLWFVCLLSPSLSFSHAPKSPNGVSL